MTGGLPRRCAAEVLGTAILVGVGTGAIVAANRAGLAVPGLIAAAWFAAVAIPIFLFATVSGSHLNPVVTLTLVLARRFPRAELPAYAGAQLLGAFAGSFAVLLALGSGAHLGATLPAGGDLLRTFVLELAFTAALLASVLWLTAPGPTPSALALLTPPAVVGASTYLIGPWTGSSLNPFRTIAPAVLSGAYLGIWVYFAAALVAVAPALVFARAFTPTRG